MLLEPEERTTTLEQQIQIIHSFNDSSNKVMYLLTNDEKAFGFIVTPKPPLLAVVIVPRGFCPKMRPC